MRELKFKAWDYITNKMYGPYTLTELISDAPTDLVDVQDNWRVKPWLKFLQFTGFKDGVGNEIYECDLVRHSLNDEVGVVDWISQRGDWFIQAFRCALGALCFPASWDDELKIEYLEVVGNFHVGNNE